jgi:pseudaminic acid biosynthesis-associated methylase
VDVMLDSVTTQPWAGEPGDAYFARSPFETNLDRQKKFLAHILCGIPFSSVTEYGCGDGVNLSAIQSLFPRAQRQGVEINAHAADQAKQRGHDVIHGDCLGVAMDADLVLWCGTLIHIPPALLPLAHRITNASAKSYVLMAEYFNPTPVEVPYRDGIYLGKRDFAGEFMGLFPQWKLKDYGFAYRRDETLGNQDDMTWFLMERT